MEELDRTCRGGVDPDSLQVACRVGIRGRGNRRVVDHLFGARRLGGRHQQAIWVRRFYRLPGRKFPAPPRVPPFREAPPSTPPQLRRTHSPQARDLAARSRMGRPRWPPQQLSGPRRERPPHRVRAGGPGVGQGHQLRAARGGVRPRAPLRRRPAPRGGPERLSRGQDDPGHYQRGQDRPLRGAPGPPATRWAGWPRGRTAPAPSPATRPQLSTLPRLTPLLPRR